MIDRKIFYTKYRQYFGRLNQSQVNGINFLLDKLHGSTVFNYANEYAYILATIMHETADTFQPVVEGYWMKSNRVEKLYNYYKTHNRGAVATIFPNGVNGLTYEGRGYVQLTHNFNYERFGILETPQEALQPEAAYRILEKGMSGGLFTGKKLGSYVNENTSNYYSARKVINGLDRATLIAGYAEKFYDCIEFSDIQYTESEITDIMIS
jgi:predicted chitinase